MTTSGHKVSPIERRVQLVTAAQAPSQHRLLLFALCLSMSRQRLAAEQAFSALRHLGCLPSSNSKGAHIVAWWVDLALQERRERGLLLLVASFIS